MKTINEKYKIRKDSKMKKLVSESLIEKNTGRLFEDLGNLSKFKLPKEWIRDLIVTGGSYYSAGPESEMETVNIKEPYEIKRAFDKENVEAIFIKIEGEWKYYVKKISTRKYGVTDRDDTEEYAKKDQYGRRHISGRVSFLEYSRPGIEEWLQDKDIEEAIAVYLDVERRKKASKRAKLRDIKDPLEQPSDQWSSQLSPRQKARKEKYIEVKKPKLERGLEKTIQNIRRQLMDNFDEAIEKNIDDIRKGYDWYSSKEEIGKSILKGINLKDFQRFAKAYSILRNEYKDPMDLTRALKKIGI